jgi:hypothetical protein
MMMALTLMKSSSLFDMTNRVLSTVLRRVLASSFEKTKIPTRCVLVCAKLSLVQSGGRNRSST